MMIAALLSEEVAGSPLRTSRCREATTCSHERHADGLRHRAVAVALSTPTRGGPDTLTHPRSAAFPGYERAPSTGPFVPESAALRSLSNHQTPASRTREGARPVHQRPGGRRRPDTTSRPGSPCCGFCEPPTRRASPHRAATWRDGSADTDRACPCGGGALQPGRALQIEDLQDEFDAVERVRGALADAGVDDISFAAEIARDW